MSKKITVELPDQPRGLAPSDEDVRRALKGQKVLNVLEVVKGSDGWSAVVEVQAAKPALKRVAKPKVEEKKPAAKQSLGKKKESK